MYNRTNWIDKKTIITAEAMNNIEDGIVEKISLNDENGYSINLIHNDALNIDQIEATSSTGEKTTLSFAADTDHVQDRTGRTQEQINRALYKGFGKEFASNGEDIIVSNGLKGSVLKGKLEGQTVKNYLTERFDKDRFGVSIPKVTDSMLTQTGSTKFFNLEGYTVAQLRNLKLVFFVLKNTAVKTSSYGTIKNYAFLPANYILGGATGVFEVPFSSSYSGEETDIPSFSYLNVEQGEIDYYVMLVEKDANITSYFNGLSSTKAIINHNDVRYPIYATEEDKVQGKVIELNKVGDVVDTLEILEDGSGMWSNIISMTDFNNFKETWVYNSNLTNTIAYAVNCPMDAVKYSMCLVNKHPSHGNSLGTANINDIETTVITENALYFYVDKTKVPTLSDFDEWLKDVVIYYRSTTPTITYIQKELMPIIPTSDETIELPSSMLGVATLEETHEDNDDKLIATLEEPIEECVEQMDSMFTQEPMVSPLAVISNPTGLFSFGENVKPSKVAITVPVVSSVTELDTIVTQHSADITAIDKKATTNTSSINSLKTTVNNYGTRLTTADSSIKSLESKVDSLDKTQEKVNNAFYKGFGKEFLTYGDDIVVENGLEGRVLGAKIEGQTVRNYGMSPLENSSNIDKGTNYVDGWFVKKNNETRIGGIEKYYCKDVKPSTEYDIYFFIRKNTIAKQTDKECVIGADAYTSSLFNAKQFTKHLIPTNTTGIFKITITTQDVIDESKPLFRVINNHWSSAFFPDPSGEFEYCINVVEKGAVLAEPIPFGLSSAKAIISNNGQAYAIYEPIMQNEVMKALSYEDDKAYWNYRDVIKLNKVGDVADTLEIKEDGSGVLVSHNIKEFVLSDYTISKVNPSPSANSIMIKLTHPDLHYFTWQTRSIECDKFESVREINAIWQTDKSIGKCGVASDNTIWIGASKDIVSDIESAKTYLESVNPKFIMASKPITTIIPKESMPPIIPTYTSNVFTFGKEVKPSKASITLPVNANISLMESLERKIAELEYQQIMNEV